MMWRDHSQPCKHGYLSQHPTPKGEGPFRLGDGFAYDLCPGGAPVDMMNKRGFVYWREYWWITFTEWWLRVVLRRPPALEVDDE